MGCAAEAACRQHTDVQAYFNHGTGRARCHDNICLCGLGIGWRADHFDIV